jgi:tRNA (cmo5U34)-methyltransferase
MSDMDKIDKVYAHYREKVCGFKFDDAVASVFDDMIRRSVPGYATVIGMTKVFAEHYAAANTNCYDLGCSLGATTLAMRQGIKKPGVRIIAVDNSHAMIEQCGRHLNSDVNEAAVDLVEADIADVCIENASIVAMNYTLQFFSPDRRGEMIRRIYEGLVPGGILILSEKIKFDDQRQNNFQIDMYHEFKRLNGYSSLEVSQKRKALENVLIPDTLETHYSRLSDAGFSRSWLWFQCFNFASLAAFKD